MADETDMTRTSPARVNPTTPTVIDRPIVYFDGVCSLCNSSVDAIVRRDRHARFRFAPLQGETARRRGVTPPSGSDPQGWSMVLEQDGRRYVRSDAALHIIAGLGGAYRMAKMLFVIPRPLRDAVYRLVARNRYKWFGKKESCRLPTPEEADRFLP